MQVVWWWPRWVGFRILGPWPYSERVVLLTTGDGQPSVARVALPRPIYDWRLVLGFVELRKWSWRL